MKHITSAVLLLALVLITGCNNDEPKFSSSQIQKALFEMKGTYHGKMRVSYYHGDKVSDESDCTVVSRDSLTINMDLAPMASTIADESIAARLHAIGVVQVRAGYEFLQMDELYSFVLHPDDVVCLDEDGVTETVRIVFSQIFGGDANWSYQNIMFNLSPTELWVDDEKYDPFRQLVYHYEGTYE